MKIKWDKIVCMNLLCSAHGALVPLSLLHATNADSPVNGETNEGEDVRIDGQDGGEHVHRAVHTSHLPYSKYKSVL